MSYAEAKAKYAALGIDTDAAIEKLKTVPVALHCWQGDDVRGFDTDPNKPLTGGIQTTGNYPGRARTPEELMADIDKVISLVPGQVKMNLHACYAIFDEENGGWVDRDKLERLTALCKEHGFFQISGEDINSPRQSFRCKALDDPKFGYLIDATYTLIEYENAATADLAKAKEQYSYLFRK